MNMPKTQPQTRQTLDISTRLIPVGMLIVVGCATPESPRIGIDQLYQQAVTARAQTARAQSAAETANPTNLTSQRASPAPSNLSANQLAQRPATSTRLPNPQTARATFASAGTQPSVVQSITDRSPDTTLPANARGYSRPAYSKPAGTVRFASAYQEESPAIDEYFNQTDIREAIDLLAESSQQKVVLDDSVVGDVTMHLVADSFEEALTRLLMPVGAVFRNSQDTFFISTPDPSAPLFDQIAVQTQYKPMHHKTAELIELLPVRLTDFIQTSEHRNLLVIDAPDQIARDIVRRLDSLDEPVPQIELEAIVCVTAPASEFRFGMDWNHAVKLDSSEQLNLGLKGLAFNGAASPWGISNMFNDFATTSAFVQLLAQEGYVTIRAAPRVTTKDGEQATISIARETFFSLQPASNNVLFRQDVQQVEAGITLIITPHVRGNSVTVDIERAEVSEDIRSNPREAANATNPYPIISRRQVTTQVDVLDGNTIVIGGLVQRQTVSRERRVPGFGSLPVVGPLFRTTEQQEQEAEVAIFISPRIIHSN